MAAKLSHKSTKVNYYGIEVDPEITWNRWEPGNKYIKKLILKNVKYITQKLNFSVPEKDVFTTTFPKTITLSAGTSFCLPITFKPHKRDVFEDKIDFQTTDGDIFTVLVKALLPRFAVDLPDKISCGIVAAHDTNSETILVTNKSELETPFNWCFEDPYVIEPQNGILMPFETEKFKIHFQPKDVGTFSMTIPFLFGSQFSCQKTLLVSSVAKYPNISIMVDHMSMTEVVNEDNQIVVDFGMVSVGKTYRKLLQIQNASMVNASVEISRADTTNPIDWVFSCPLEFSPVHSSTVLNIMMECHPKLVLTDYVENFIIKVSNRCATFKVKCIGKSDGPAVSVSYNSVNFHQVDLGDTSCQPIILTNSSLSSAVPFQFVIDPNTSVFHIDKCNGIIKPEESVKIIVTFRPQNPIQYYRKIVCLVPDQEPIFVDLLGTCHDINTRPHILEMKHIHWFRKRQVDGLSYFSPELLLSYTTKNLLKVDENNHLTIISEEMNQMCEMVSPLSKWKDYFFSHNETDVVFSTPYIGQDKHSVFFDGLEYISNQQIQERLIAGTLDSDDLKHVNEKEKNISLKNNTKGPVIIQWTSLQGPAKNKVFSITPATMEISPSETVIFTLKFKPDGPDRVYGSELEAFVYFKSQRQFELVNDKFISPSFCVLVRCTGHSFFGKRQPFRPKFEFDQAQVVFPSINLNETAFRCLTLTNKGEQPMLFNLQKIKESFSIKPTIGQIDPGMQQIFVIRCEPTSIAQYLSSIEIKLNSRNDFVQVIPVLGSADKAVVNLENNSQIFFSPTNIGNTSSQRYSIKNTSRIPLKFEWKLRPEDSFVIRVYPNNGLLLPNEILSQQWFFTPKVVGKTTIKGLLMVQGISPFGSLTDPQYFPLRIIGKGEEASLDVQGSDSLDFGSLVVGSSAYQTFDLMNSSDVTVFYQLNVTVDEENDLHNFHFNERDFDIADCISIKDPKGMLPGRCKKTIYVSVSPMQRRSYKLKIGYVLIDNDELEWKCMSKGNELLDSKEITNRICAFNEKLVTVSMTGVFPTLQITDVQGTGPSQWLSKLNLWKNLSLDNFNVCLDSDPTTSELIFTMGTRASFHRNVPISTRAIIDMNLGAAPQNSDLTEIRLMFENCGSVETKFAFMFPEDLEIELEYWAETGEYTEEQLHQMKIQDNKLFDIQPRKSVVPVGESVTVCFTYNHLSVGTDRIPILLKLDHGREILLNLIGVTLHLERCYIHFPSNKHIFHPTSIGLSKTPIQYYELYNPGAVPVHFELDLSPLKQLMEENYNLSILQCLNPFGDILPGQTCRLEWMFTPLEPKTYVVEIPFHISNGDCHKIQFTAIGYDQRCLGDALSPDQGLAGESGVPSVQSIVLPNQIAKLNVERLALGMVPIFTLLKRVVFLNNVTSNKNITFSWNITNANDGDYIFIYPQNGRLMTKESVTCHVTLHTRSIPKFFDINLICEIYDESKIIEYREELNKWEDEERRRNVEFTISDTSGKSANVKQHNLEKPPFDNSKSSFVSYLSPIINSKGNSGKVSIKANKSNSSDKTISEMKNSNLWFKPEMPRPFFLHLGITGRSCPIEEFQKEYPDALPKYTLDKPSMLEQNTPLSVLESDTGLDFPVESHFKEQVTLESVLTDIVGSIMDDPEFLDAVKNMRHEPIPFYAQLPECRINSNKSSSGRIESITDEGSTGSGCKELKIKPNMDRELPKQFEVIDEDNPLQLSTDTERDKPTLDDQAILESLSFGNLVESLIENMIVNIVSEANAREVDLTSRPRLIALPPRSARNKNITD